MLTDKTLSNILVLRRFDFYSWPIENKGMKRKTGATLWLINVSVIKVTKIGVNYLQLCFIILMTIYNPRADATKLSHQYNMV